MPPHISRNTSRTLLSYWFISNNLNNSRSKTSSWSIYTIYQVKSFSPPWFFIEFSSFSLKTRIHTSYKTTKQQLNKKKVFSHHDLWNKKKDENKKNNKKVKFLQLNQKKNNRRKMLKNLNNCSIELKEKTHKKNSLFHNNGCP